MTKLRNILTVFSFGFMLNTSCITSSRSFYLGERAGQRQSLIEHGGSIENHFLNHQPIAELSEDDREELKQLIELDYSDYFNRHIEFPMPNFNITGHRLYITRIGQTEINASRLYTNQLSEESKKGIEFLVERYGPEFDNIVNLNRSFQEEALIASRSSSAAAEFDRSHHVSPRYSADFQDFSGFALPLVFYHYITLREDVNTLHRLISVWEHENAHTLIFNEMDLQYSTRLLSAVLGINSNDDLVTIHETACDIISDRIQPSFENHIEGELRTEYDMHLNSGLRFDAAVNEIVENYQSLSPEVRVARRRELFESYSNLIFERSGKRDYVINEAKLAHLMRYSGERRLRRKLETILDNVGPNGFIQIIPKLYNRDDLNFAYRNSYRIHDALELARMLNSKHASEREPINF